MDDLVVNETLVVAGSELTWSAVRSGGPGGQNVNKVATKVVLRFDPRSPSLPLHVAARLSRMTSERLDSEGCIVVRCDETRSQAQNLELARERLAELIRAACVVPKRRRATRPSNAQKRARLTDKRRTGAKKQDRRGGGWD